MRRNHRIVGLAAAVAAGVAAVSIPLCAMAYTPVPVDGTRTLLDIFPGPDSPAAARTMEVHSLEQLFRIANDVSESKRYNYVY